MLIAKAKKTMAKQKKIKVECEDCGAFSISFSGKMVIECCPFCGDSVNVILDEAPILKDFDSLDSFEDEYYGDEDLDD